MNELEDERDFLLRSLEDLEAEHAAGDIEPDDYQALRDDYTARAAHVLRSIDEGKASFEAARRPRSAARTIAVVAAVAAVALTAGLLVAQTAGRRDPGQTLTGDVDQTLRERLNECLSGERTAPPVDTLKCYDSILDEDAANVGALTYRGWFLVRAGGELVDKGLEYLDRATAIDPAYPDPYVFRAVAYARQQRTTDALAQLDKFDALNAPPDAQALADTLRTQLESAPTSTTTTTTTN